MPTVTASLRSEDGSLVETLSGVFDEFDIDILRKFVKRMSRVRVCRLFTRGMPSISNISVTAESGMKLVCAPYENSELHELLHVLRPVILEKETSSFQAVSGLLRRRFKSRRFSDHLKPIRKMFKDGELGSYMQLYLGARPFFDKSTLDLWLNAEQYHTDEDKAEAWADFERSLTTENARALVMAQLHSKVKALLHLEHIVGLVLRSADGRTTRPS
jgi:hypothetical protein